MDNFNDKMEHLNKKGKKVIRVDDDKNKNKNSTFVYTDEAAFLLLVWDK